MLDINYAGLSYPLLLTKFAIIAFTAIVITATVLLVVSAIYDLWDKSKLRNAFELIIAKQRKREMPIAIQRMMKMPKSNDEIPKWLDQWMKKADERIKKSGASMPVGRYIAGVILGAILGFFIGLVLLKNPVIAIIMFFSGFLIPDMILIGYIQKRRIKIIEQLGAAVRIFTSEYADTAQVPRALYQTAKRMPDPLGSILMKATRNISVGKSKDEVLDDLIKDLDFDYGKIFVYLLGLAWEDSSVKPLFARLATRISSLQSLLQKNNSSLAYGRFMAMGINALILPMYILVRWKIPGAGEFMLVHPVGRLLVTLSFVSVLIGLVMDRVLSEVNI